MEEAIVPEIYDPDMIDEHIYVVSEESIFVGMSSGAARLAALKILPDFNQGALW